VFPHFDTIQMCDGQTEGRTGGQTDEYAVACKTACKASFAARCKNYEYIYIYIYIWSQMVYNASEPKCFEFRS